jgi:hypothetical protein
MRMARSPRNGQLRAKIHRLVTQTRNQATPATNARGAVISLMKAEGVEVAEMAVPDTALHKATIIPPLLSEIIVERTIKI